jgi:hypothetical protein
MLSRAVVILAVLAAAVRPAEACSKRHQSPFELFDLADTVAYVKVRSVPPPKGQLPGAGDVELAVTKVIKGDPTRTSIVARETNTSCRTGYVAGRSALVFLNKDGRSTGLYEGYVTDLATWKDVIDRYAAARDASARLDVVLAAIASDSRRVAVDAAYYLVDRPELFTRIDQAGRDRLIELAEHPAGRGGAHNGIEDDGMFTLLLARLRDPKAEALIRAGHGAWAREALGLIAVTKFEAETDPSKLADAIERTGAPERIAALDRCERVRGIELFPFTDYLSGMADEFWKTLAAACRSGAPVRL